MAGWLRRARIRSSCRLLRANTDVFTSCNYTFTRSGHEQHEIQDAPRGTGLAVTHTAGAAHAGARRGRPALRPARKRTPRGPCAALLSLVGARVFHLTAR